MVLTKEGKAKLMEGVKSFLKKRYTEPTNKLLGTGAKRNKVQQFWDRRTRLEKDILIGGGAAAGGMTVLAEKKAEVIFNKLAVQNPTKKKPLDYWDSAVVFDKAQRERADGKSNKYFSSAQYVDQQIGGSVRGTVMGAAGGYTAGGVTGGIVNRLVRGKGNPIRSADGKLISMVGKGKLQTKILRGLSRMSGKTKALAALGGLVGGTVGYVAGNINAEKDYFKSRGIEYNAWGEITKMSPDAKKKYLKK